MKIILLSATLFLSFCHDPNARSSAVVRQIESAGSGDISSMTPPEIQAWLLRHNDPVLISSVASHCQTLSETAIAGWDLRTAEGRACSAATAANMTNGSEQFTVDQRKY